MRKMKTIRIVVKTVWALTAAFCVAVFGVLYYMQKSLPSKYQVCEGDSLKISCAVPIEATKKTDKNFSPVQANLMSSGSEYKVDLKILGIIPVKTASVSVVPENSVMVLGQPFGIKIYSDGVMVVGMTDVDSKSGLKNPAEDAGIKKGDIISSVDELSVYSNDDIARIIEESNGENLTFSIIRNGRKSDVKVKPEKSKSENKYKIGLWVRDSSAGIGTLSFYYPKGQVAAGLGHAICDSDTGEIIPLNYGELVGADIISVNKGKTGSAGELKGIFKSNSLGKFLLNSTTGVYGDFSGRNDYKGTYMIVANKQEVKEGNAEILSTVEGDTPKKYSCKITKVHFNDDSDTQNMIIKITDKKLLQKTGGIVQGMSGSPIIQNGKLVGAVTHVFVNDLSCGYGIFAENMLKSAQKAAEKNLKKAS